MDTSGVGRSPRRVRVVACLVVAAAAWAGGCGEGATSLAGPTADKCQISVTAFTRTFAAAGGTGSVTLATTRECSWSAASSTQWISFPRQPSGQGPASFGFVVAANPAPRPREGAIEVSGQRLGIAQEAAPCRFDLDSGTTRATASGGSASVRVSAMAGCTWRAESLTPWIRVTGEGRGDGPGTVSFAIDPNTGAARTGTLMVAGLSHRVEQAAAVPGPPAPPPPPPPTPPSPPPCEYRLSPASVTVAAEGGEVALSLRTDSSCAWQASDDAAWVRVGPPSSGTGSAAIPVSVEANTGQATRRATVQVASASVALVQVGAPTPPPPCTASVSPTSASFTSEGGEAAVKLTVGADCEWTATSGGSWLEVQPGSGAGDAVLELTAAPNPDSAARKATATIAGETVSVSQDGAPVEEVRVEGRVRDLAGTCPIVRFRVRGTTITTSPDTRYGPDSRRTACRDLRNGRIVVITGVVRDGDVEATLILFETNGPNP